MSGIPQHVLFLSANGESTSLVKQKLAQSGAAVVEVKSLREAQDKLLGGAYQVFLNRCAIVTEEQFSILNFFKAHNISTRVIVLSQSGSVDDAVRVVKAGASNFIVSKVLDERVADVVLQNLDQERMKTTETKAEALPVSRKAETILVGKSPLIEEVRIAVGLVARSQTPVLITGESGTGKEVVARLVHLQSDRADCPFIALNCAALPKDVIENELFGHERGAFTGALEKKMGCFDLANHGTLFFDEIGEMSPETQAKLLRAIETKAFRRLGGKEEVKVDVRTIAATNKKMADALKSGEFREDLYYRFSVIEIFIPPLREHREDIPLLVDHFLSILSGQYNKPRQQFSEASIEILKAYDWPGNVRELRNVIERAVVTCHEEMIMPRCLHERLSLIKNVGKTINIPIGITAREAERRFILQTLAAVGNNKTKAAQLLGLSRKTLHNKLRTLLN